MGKVFLMRGRIFLASAVLFSLSLGGDRAQSVLLGWDIPGRSSATNALNTYAPVTNAMGVSSAGSISMELVFVLCH